jgi:hypothetical protein
MSKFNQIRDLNANMNASYNHTFILVSDIIVRHDRLFDPLLEHKIIFVRVIP